MKKPVYKDADTRVMLRRQYFVEKQQPQLIIRLGVSEAAEWAGALLYFQSSASV